MNSFLVILVTLLTFESTPVEPFSKKVYKLAPTTFSSLNRYRNTDALDRASINCSLIFNNNSRNNLISLQEWKHTRIEDEILNSSDKCDKIKKLLSFNKWPMSLEEADFPLAFGILAYTEPTQFLFMLNAFYQPQNLYCIGVSENADEKFKRIVKILPDCFENIHVMMRPTISWGSFEILNSTYRCLEYLALQQHDWKYYQYLSGFDVPLKTNSEMVKIFKALNGNANFEILENPRISKTAKPPLPMFKSSLSALVPRAAADFLVASKLTQQVLNFLVDTEIPDESFWATVLGNIDVFPVPGGQDAALILKTKKELAEKYKHIPYDELGWNYYISREQVWINSLVPCHGKFTKESCVFGIRDLPNLMKQPPLVGHKFYFDFESAALFCVFKKIRKRSFNPEEFSADLYSQLPQYELMKGIAVSNMTRATWLR